MNIINKYSFQREQLYRGKSKLLERTGSGSADRTADKMLSYLDDFKDVFARGEPEKRKDFIRMFVKNVVMCPASKQAKIRFYIRPLSDIIK